MNIEVKEMESTDFTQVENLTEELYAELGEPTADIRRLTDDFMTRLVENQSSMVLLIRSFVTAEVITLATLTTSNAISKGKYGVMDEIYTRVKFRSCDRKADLQEGVRILALQKGWDRIDVAAPTDAWHRTVRFHPNQQLKLTAPKFKHVVIGCLA